MINLIPQHYNLTLFISSWATISCLGFCRVRFFIYLKVAIIKQAKILTSRCNGTNKNRKFHDFWWNFFNYGEIWLQSLIWNRLNPRYEMQAVWLSIQRNHPLAELISDDTAASLTQYWVDNGWKHGVKILHDWKNSYKRCEFLRFYL